MLPIPILVALIAAPVLVLAALAGVLYRLWSRVREVRENQSACLTAQDLTELRDALAEVGRRVSLLETDMAAVPSMPKGTINVSKRGQVIRLHRRGDDTAEIAAAVGLRRAEVDLIVKLQKLAGSSALNPESRPADEPKQPVSPAVPIAAPRTLAGAILRL